MESRRVVYMGTKDEREPRLGLVLFLAADGFKFVYLSKQYDSVIFEEKHNHAEMNDRVEVLISDYIAKLRG